MIYYVLSAAINGATSLFLALFVFVKNPRSMVSRIFYLFAFSVAFWSLGYFLWQISSSAYEALYYCRFLMAGAIFIPSTFFHFTVNLIKLSKEYTKSVILWYVVSFCLLILDFTPLLVKNVRPRMFFPYWPTAGPAYVFFLMMFVGLIVYSIILLSKAMKASSGFERIQIKYVLLGIAAGFIGGVTNYPLWYDIHIPPYGNIMVSLYMFLVGYAIIRYHLLNVNIALTRAGIFAFVYTLVLGLPLYVGFRYNLWHYSTWMMLVLATSGPLIYNYLRRRAEGVLLRDQKQYQRTLLKASQGMTLIKELDRLLKLIVHILTRSAKITFTAIYLYDKNSDRYILKAKRGKIIDIPDWFVAEDSFVKYILNNKGAITPESISLSHGDYKDLQSVHDRVKSMSIAVVVPSFIQNNLLGFIVMGDKISFHSYTEDDLNVFSVLANNAALAIENAIFYEETGKTLAEKFHEHRIWSLGKMGSGIGHQINNRFTVIVLKLDVARLVELEKLKKTKLTEEQAGIVGKLYDAFLTARDEAMHGSEIATTLTYFSKKTTEHKGALLQDVIKGSLNLLSCKFNISELNIQQDIKDGGPQIMGSLSQLQDVFMNMLDNAHDAMTKKEEEIEANLLKVSDKYKPQVKISANFNNKEWTILVQDNGIGMTPEQLNQIFIPFFTTKATSEKGTGLGLAIMKQIVEAHHGFLEIKSEYGKGTTFIVKLPVFKEAAVDTN